MSNPQLALEGVLLQYLTVEGGPAARALRKLPPGLLELLQPIHSPLGGPRGEDVLAVSGAEIRQIRLSWRRNDNHLISKS